MLLQSYADECVNNRLGPANLEELTFLECRAQFSPKGDAYVPWT